MADVGRKQERELILFGRYMRVASKLKARKLGVSRYTWEQISLETGKDPSLLVKAVSGETKRPAVENVWAWIRVLEPGERLERLICSSLRYSTEKDFTDAETSIDALEQEEDIQ